MARLSSRRRSYRVSVDGPLLAAMAADHVSLHQQHIDDGFHVGSSSGVWRRKDGSVTCRFVYRKQLDNGRLSIVHTMHLVP